MAPCAFCCTARRECARGAPYGLGVNSCNLSTVCVCVCVHARTAPPPYGLGDNSCNLSILCVCARARSGAFEHTGPNMSRQRRACPRAVRRRPASARVAAWCMWSARGPLTRCVVHVVRSWSAHRYGEDGGSSRSPRCRFRALRPPNITVADYLARCARACVRATCGARPSVSLSVPPPHRVHTYSGSSNPHICNAPCRIYARAVPHICARHAA